MSNSLRTRHAELTRRLILDAAIAMLCEQQQGAVEPQGSGEQGPGELSIRALADRAGMSERTVFRYFASRDDLLDAVAAEMNARLAPPPVPEHLEELPRYPALIFARFEETAALTRAALSGEVYERIRTGDVARRGAVIRRLIDEAAPQVSAHKRRLVAANIHYHVVATTWNYYRTRFGLSAGDTVAAARMAIEHAIRGLSAEG